MSLDILRHNFEKQAEELGLVTYSFDDDPGQIHEPHSHGRVDILTISGTAELRLGKEPWLPVCAGEVTVIPAGVEHRAIAGQDGWGYVLACTEDEARNQGFGTPIILDK
ncbi:MAG TPA: hypothetical protein VG604_03435 [Candidatus Saccharimonadales bacterium]|nr:hypothetical protein [Candidatus Saccharimonadales bacterium]